MDKLDELIRSGPDPRYSMKSVVLGRYEDILKARQLMRAWMDIAAALGFEGRGKDLAGCFSRVDKGIKSGKLKVPVTSKATTQHCPPQKIGESSSKPVVGGFDFEAARIDKNR
jgi:hypothetical protein